MVKFSSPLGTYSWRWAERLSFLAIFPSPLFRLLTFPFILAFVYCPSSTCRVNLSKTDTCPISLYPKSLGVVVKAKECDSVRRRALNGSENCFPWIFGDLISSSVLYRFCPSFRWNFSSAEVCTILGCISSLSCALSYWAWAIALLGLDLWIPHGQMGLAHKSLGPHNCYSTKFKNKKNY